MIETLCDVNGVLSQAGCSYSLSTGVLAKIGKKAADLHLTEVWPPPRQTAGQGLQQDLQCLSLWRR